jgi:tRNA (mo5U34)-methyltransferase
MTKTDQPLRDELIRQTREFNERARELGYGDPSAFFWYHTVDLGRGLVTPGSYDFRGSWPAFGFPRSMAGMRALDVGSATGFFAFELEKRGAQVTSVEVPSMADLDVFPGEDVRSTLAKLERMLPVHSVQTPEQLDLLFHRSSLQEFYHHFLDGPFLFCREVLHSNVARHYAPIYDLSAETLGGQFDWVFVGDVLLHTIHPLKALAAVASVCRGTLVIAQSLPHPAGPQPMMLYVGGDTLGADSLSWWLPNLACLEQILRKLGFADVRVVARQECVVRPAGHTYGSTIIHASR